MKILIANLGSTSFKYRLFEMADERQIAQGSVERIGEEASKCAHEWAGTSLESVESIPDHAAALDHCLARLTDSGNGCLAQADEVTAIGFKAVHGGRISGAQLVTPDLLNAMEEMSAVAPAHNPPYIAAMRQLGERYPNLPLVAAFETAFHQSIPPSHALYAVPWEWQEQYNVRRWGFHGASHRYIAESTTQRLNQPRNRVISCHLGGSSSICAIRDGVSVATSMGMSPQSGLPQSNRAGDIDPFVLRHVEHQSGRDWDSLFEEISTQGGLKGLSGVGADLRDLEEAATAGNERARAAIDVYVAAIRHYVGAYWFELGGCDLIAFTGGIGQNSTAIRARVCHNLAEIGVELDEQLNQAARDEQCISTANSRVQVWVVPTNEEIVVAREVRRVLEERKSCSSPK